MRYKVQTFLPNHGRYKVGDIVVSESNKGIFKYFVIASEPEDDELGSYTVAMLRLSTWWLWRKIQIMSLKMKYITK